MRPLPDLSGDTLGTVAPPETDLASLEQKIYQLNMRPEIGIHEVADTLLKGIEQLYPGAFCSILKLDRAGALRHFSAPSLPEKYVELIDGSVPGPRKGSCGTAVYRKKPVIVSDIETDELWEDYREGAAQFGLKACWSLPIYHTKGEVLGSFAIYYRHQNSPEHQVLRTVERLAHLIGMLMENNQMMEDLRISNERYHLAAKATHDMIWDWDLDKNEIFRSDEGLRNIYGLWDNDPILRVDDWMDRIHPEDKESVLVEVMAVQNAPGKVRFDTEYRFLKGDGSYAYVSDRGYIIRDIIGKPIRVIGAVKDITEEIRTLQMLQESQERYRELFSNNPLPMWILDLATYHFLEVNQMAVQHYGYSAEEFAAMRLHQIRVGLAYNITDRHPTERSYIREQSQHVKRSGQVIHVEVFSQRMIYKGRDAMLMLANDVTKNILLQEQLAKERVQRENEVMKATIAAQETERYELGKELHDNVNQILTSAKLYLDCVKMYDENKEEYRTSCNDLISNAIEEIRKLCKALTPPRLRDVTLIQSIEDILRNVAITTSITISFVHEGFDESILEEGLKITIYRIIQEQTTNILKHAEAATMTIELDNLSDILWVRVKDDGIGFERSALRKGVGFTNMLNRAAIYAGRVEIQSAPGKGCTVSVAFPHKGVPV